MHVDGRSRRDNCWSRMLRTLDCAKIIRKVAEEVTKTVSVDWHEFLANGRAVTISKKQHRITDIIIGATIGATLYSEMIPAITAYAATPDAVPAMAGDASWSGPVIHLLVDQGLPLALVMGTWACLEAIIGRPASAMERLKWAVIGYLALQYVPSFIRHIHGG